MATSWKFYNDSALTQELTTGLVLSQNKDGSTGDIDGVIYFGSNSAGVSVQAESSPGVDQIVINIIDSDGSAAAGPQAVDLKLALSNAGLAAAVAGDPLNLGTTLSSGAGNSVACHYRQATPDAPVGTYNEISLQTNSVRET